MTNSDKIVLRTLRGHEAPHGFWTLRRDDAGEKLAGLMSGAPGLVDYSRQRLEAVFGQKDLTLFDNELAHFEPSQYENILFALGSVALHDYGLEQALLISASENDTTRERVLERISDFHAVGLIAVIAHSAEQPLAQAAANHAASTNYVAADVLVMAQRALPVAAAA